jgi:hypothetical protein
MRHKKERKKERKKKKSQYARKFNNIKFISSIYWKYY